MLRLVAGSQGRNLVRSHPSDSRLSRLADKGELVELPAGRQARTSLVNMYSIYVLRSSRRKYIYVGMTNNLERRVSEHQTGRVQTTKPYRPFVLLFTENFETRQDARKREKYLKSGYGKEWIKSEYP